MSEIPVAITGLGATTPLGGTVPELWESLTAGRSGVRSIDPAWVERHELPVTFAAPMAVAPDTVLAPAQAKRMDRCQQAALVAAREAWEAAGSPEIDPERLAVAFGTGIGGVNTLLTQDDTLEQLGPRRVHPRTVPMLMANGPSALISIEYGATGGSYTPVSACASGADAIAQAARLIRAGDADVVIAGGTEAAITPVTIAAFAQVGALSRRNDDPEHASRPFDIDRDGFVLGEGAGALVLERADYAAARGAHVYGLLGGYGVTSDAYHITAPDPEGSGQARAMITAVTQAGLTAGDITHVNCHATSTGVGDIGEAKAIRRALGDQAVLTAPKSSFGHLVGAAGAVEAIVAVLTLTHRLIPPTLNLEHKDPEVELDVVTGAPRPFDGDAVVSNSFGFGGQNVSLLFRRP